MPIRRMSETDLNGVLFVEFPTDWTLARSRLALERLIRRCGLVEINPANIYTALFAERMRLSEQLPEDVRRRKVSEAWNAREERIKKRVTVPSTNVNLTDEWSF